MNNALLDNLPPPWPVDLTRKIRDSLVQSGRTIIVLDDDPTGTQTVHDVPVLTRFESARLVDALSQHPPVLFLLTNSRSLNADQSTTLHRELTCQLKSAAQQVGCELELISRSDSTLRGHFPLETDTITKHWPEQAELGLLMPFFLEGGRVTLQSQHFVTEGDRLVPAHETPFALDPVFGFRNSFLPAYVEEKTKGRIQAEQVVTIPIDVIRGAGPDGVQAIIDSAPLGSVCVVDGVEDRDAQVVAAAVTQSPRKILARVAASYVRARAGLEKRPLLTSSDLRGEGMGGLVVVGSHVPKSTAQWKYLLENRPACVSVEVSVRDILASRESTIASILSQVMSGLQSNQDVVLFTSREIVTGNDDVSNLEISRAVSQALVSVVAQLTVRPRYLIAKGGITSSDVATQGLNVEQAVVAGSILPGVPVWRLGSESKFPGMHYVIFPGNVGRDEALSEAVEKLQ